MSRSHECAFNYFCFFNLFKFTYANTTLSLLLCFVINTENESANHPLWNFFLKSCAPPPSLLFQEGVSESNSTERKSKEAIAAAKPFKR